MTEKLKRLLPDWLLLILGGKAIGTLLFLA